MVITTLGNTLINCKFIPGKKSHHFQPTATFLYIKVEKKAAISLLLQTFCPADLWHDVCGYVGEFEFYFRIGLELIAEVHFDLNVWAYKIFHAKYNYEETTAVVAVRPVGVWTKYVLLEAEVSLWWDTLSAFYPAIWNCFHKYVTV